MPGDGTFELNVYEEKNYQAMKMRCSSYYIYWFFAAIVCLGALACSNTLPKFGVGGRYEEGKDQFFRGRGGDMDKAVVSLEYVVSQDPTYKNSLTYLGRAYYRKERYKDAYVILQRAVAVNRDDEIAWLALGVTELRLGQNEKGIETLKGGITLASKVLVEGYHNYDRWDLRGAVRTSVRRSAFYLTKGVEEKENIIQSTERLLAQIDDEENAQKNNHSQNMRQLYQR
jgi:tetratricopeptide (TPR) repeat protein